MYTPMAIICAHMCVCVWENFIFRNCCMLAYHGSRWSNVTSLNLTFPHSAQFSICQCRFRNAGISSTQPNELHPATRIEWASGFRCLQFVFWLRLHLERNSNRNNVFGLFEEIGAADICCCTNGKEMALDRCACAIRSWVEHIDFPCAWVTLRAACEQLFEYRFFFLYTRPRLSRDKGVRSRGRFMLIA